MMLAMRDVDTVTVPRLLYVVAAPLDTEVDEVQPAFIIDDLPKGIFDEDLGPALIGIWYAMHLPKNRFETLDLPLGAIQSAADGVPRSHLIALVPRKLLANAALMRQLVAPHEPVLLIAPPEDMLTARKVSTDPTSRGQLVGCIFAGRY
jgi:hypothetical protein